MLVAEWNRGGVVLFYGALAFLAATLGAGDGRTVLQAAKRGAICYAVEVDPPKSWLIGWRARRGAVHGQVRILRENFFHTNLRKADVITAYLSPAAMEKLAPKLLAELKPGARVVSYRRPIPGWLRRVSVGASIPTVCLRAKMEDCEWWRRHPRTTT
jgi:hypothetical protein